MKTFLLNVDQPAVSKQQMIYLRALVWSIVLVIDYVDQLAVSKQQMVYFRALVWSIVLVIDYVDQLALIKAANGLL